MNANDADISEESQRELAAGVLKQAAQDLRWFHGATNKLERELYLGAYGWLTVDECSSPFSFLNICQLLNLAPENVRQELIGDLSLGSFGYWMRRCGRAASRFRISLASPLRASAMQIRRYADWVCAKQETRSFTTRPLWEEHFYMKTLTDIRSRSHSLRTFCCSA